MRKGQSLVLLQFLFIAINLHLGGYLAHTLSGGLMQVVGIGLGLISIAHMKLNNLSIYPEPKKGAKFVQYGVYKYLRHPMYLSVLLFIYPLLFKDIHFLNISSFVILIVVFVLKMNYEEGLLKTKFSEYEQYIQKTKRIIPLVY